MVALALSVALPGGRLPGPTVDPTTTTSTTSAVAATTRSTALDPIPEGDLGFDLAGFLERWNAISLDPELRRAVQLSSFDSLDGDAASVHLSIPDVELDWTIAAELDRNTGNVRQLRLTAPLSATEQGALVEQLGMVMMITVIENFSAIEQSGPLLDDLFDQAEAAPDLEFSVVSRTETAEYVFSLSADGGLQFEARP